MTQMESLACILGAFSAGKMPTQTQMNSWMDSFASQMDTLSNAAQDPSFGRLSSHGQKLSEDIKQLLFAYKVLGTKKNGVFIHITICIDGETMVSRR